MLGITKEQLKELPEVHYPGRVIMVNTAAKAKSALRYLNKVKQVGFDTETRPSFQKNHRYKVSLVQISTLDDECFLFRLKEIGSLDGLYEFFENPAVQKIGLSIKDDFHSLAKHREFNPAGFVELQTFVKDYDIADNSLQKIYGLIFNERISKNQRLTNWEAKDLTEGQQAYAAIDAWACQRIYNHLVAGGFDPSACPYSIDDETAQALQRSVGIHLPQFDTAPQPAVAEAEPKKKKRRKKKKSADSQATDTQATDAQATDTQATDPGTDGTQAAAETLPEPKTKAKKAKKAKPEVQPQQPAAEPAPAPKKSRYKTHSEEIAEIKERLTVLETLVNEVKDALKKLVTPRRARSSKKGSSKD